MCVSAPLHLSGSEVLCWILKGVRIAFGRTVRCGNVAGQCGSMLGGCGRFPWVLGVWCGGLCWRCSTGRAQQQYCCRQCSKDCGLVTPSKSCRSKTPRHLLRSCAVGGHLESGERTGIFTQPDKTDTPNGTTFPSRRCAPRALRADYCKLILSSRNSRTLRYSKGVGLRKYEYGYLRNSIY